MNSQSQKELLIRKLKEYYTPGDRYNLLLSLAGSFVSLGIPEDHLIKIYQNYLLPHDDENRIKLIQNTYERYQYGRPIRTLCSPVNPATYKDLFAIILSVYQGIVDYDNNNRPKISKDKQTLDEDDLHKYVVELDPIHYRLHYKYLLLRGFDEKTIKKYKVFVGVENNRDRVCFISYNSVGKVVCIIGRSIFDYNPKYKIIFGTPSDTLWNYKDRLLKRVICEGVFDAMTVEQYIPEVNAVALFGKNISLTQAKLVKNSLEVTIILDSDVSNNQLLSVIRNVWTPMIPLYIVRLPTGHDPNSLGSSIVEFFSKRKRIYNPNCRRKKGCITPSLSLD